MLIYMLYIRNVEFTGSSLRSAMQSAIKSAKRIKDDSFLDERSRITDLLCRGYNFILFFSLPFYPLSKMYKRRINFGHLTVCLGDTVFQLHDPERLRSKFLVSRMPVTTWLFEDGRWHDWDPDSECYRHVHLYERAEVKRTAIFYAALKSLSKEKQKYYEDYFEDMERDFHRGHRTFTVIQNNCSVAIDHILYREGWLQKQPFDFIPAIIFKRLVNAWMSTAREFETGCVCNGRLPQFKIQKFCPGIYSFDPLQAMVRWLQKRDNH